MTRRLITLSLLLALAAGLAPAAIQYAGGTNVNTTFTTTVGTRQEIVTGLQTTLTTAGWTVISGGGTGDVLMESATTPQSLVARVRLLDPGSGSCARFHFRNVSNSRSHTLGVFLLPAAGKIFRVVANKYQFFVFTAGVSSVREYGAGGVLYVPSFPSITEAIWAHGNSQNDSGSTAGGWRRDLQTNNSGVNVWTTVNGTQWENASNVGSPYGQQMLVSTVAAYPGVNGADMGGLRWVDDSYNLIDPLLCVGQTSLTDICKIVGEIWDGVIIANSYLADTLLTFDSHNWIALTGSNNGSSNNGTAGSLKGTLFLVVP